MRITAIENGPFEVAPSVPQGVRRSSVTTRPGPAFAEWKDPDAPALMLYLSEEPEIGRRFQYGGVTWEIIDYHDGWVARLVV